MASSGEVSAARPPNTLAGTAAPAVLQRIEWSWLAIAIAVVAVAGLTLVPLLIMVWRSPPSTQTATSAAHFTLDNYRTAYGSADTARLFVTSLQFALGSAALAFSLGAPSWSAI